MNWSYCPNCGQQGTFNALNKTEYKCSACQWLYWNNPKTCVVIAFVFTESEILFSKRAINPNKGMYDIPGGFVEYEEDPYQAAVREVKEETGYSVDPTRLEYVTTYNEEYIPGVACADMIFVYRVDQKLELTAHDDSEALEWKPISFIGSDEFVDHYDGLDKILKEYLEK